MTAAKHLLVVEDESNLAQGLKLNLELEGFVAHVAATAREASASMLETDYDLIILDVMLPDTDGFELCRRLRDSGNFVPVLMLTARNSPSDRIRGLDAGADDYLPKPFDLQELLARVRSLLRRRSWDAPEATASQQSLYRFGQTEIDFAAHDVRVAGEAVRLTHLELQLLHYFVLNPQRVISREELLEEVWNLRNYPNTRTVDNFISRLRKLFEPDPKQPRYFVSYRGAGYRFVPDP